MTDNPFFSCSDNNDKAPFRLHYIDQWRGVMLVLMTLDHVRHFFSPTWFDPLDPEHTTIMLFFTRWVTHICAPTFVFLTGVSASLYICIKPVGRQEISMYLAKRGLVLIALEILLINFEMSLSFDSSYFLQIIFVLGVSMLLLSVVIHWPPTSLVWFIIAGLIFSEILRLHNANDFGAARSLVILLSEQGLIQLTDTISFFVVYPLLPWIFLAPMGFVFASVFFAIRLDRRNEFLAAMITGLLVASIGMRFLHVAHSPDELIMNHGVIAFLLSCLNVEKYPPSLDYVFITITLSLIILRALFNNEYPPHAFRLQWLTDIGREPLFYYCAHIAVIQALAALFFLPQLLDEKLYLGWQYDVLMGQLNVEDLPAQIPGLVVTYITTVGVICIMTWLCRHYHALKKRHDNVFLRYI